MTDTRDMVVQMLDEEAWEQGEIAIVGRPVPVWEWLTKLREWEMRLSLPPLSRITSGPYDGGHVLVATGDTRLPFAVPLAALPLLRAWLPTHEYAEVVRRTPALRDAAP